MSSREASTSGATPTVSVAADVGGTFTDIVCFDEAAGRYRAAKVPTTPVDLSRAILEGIGIVAPDVASIGFAVLGTTAGLNALLERRGERVLLIATAGVGDSYLIARGSRSKLYDLHYQRPVPLVERRSIVEIGGRLDSAGVEVEPLDEEAIGRAAARFRDGRYTAIAVALLFSYLDASHELRAAEILRGELGDVPISLSHRVAREWREYERTSSTVVEAYIAPTVLRDITRLEQGLIVHTAAPALHVMQSSGGVRTARSVRAAPLQTLLSGPTGASTGGVALAERLGHRNLILVDMGGTSFDVTLVVDGEVEVVTDSTIEGQRLLMPVVNIHTIGAGGGSVAYLEGDALRVGPRSAGAVPGPACYGRGGTEPTVTDANAYLGRLSPRAFAGGRMRLDLDAARDALGTLAEPLGLELGELAEGILAIVNARMAQAIRTLTVEQGVEPRDFALVAIGGAGPMHAAFLAAELEIATVLVPPLSGVFSAWGMLQSELRHDAVTPFFRTPHTLDMVELAGAVGALHTDGRRTLAAEGVAADRMTLDTWIDMRYVGQEYHVAVRQSEVPRDPHQLADAFHAEHDRRRGISTPGAEVEVIALRVTARGDLDSPGLAPVDHSREVSGAARRAAVVFAGETYSAVVCARELMSEGTEMIGPVIIEEDTTTVVVPPHASARLDGASVLEITFEAND